MSKFLIVLSCIALYSITVLVEARPGGRVYGGTLAKTGQFPFMANFRVEPDLDVSYCGAAIISETWLVTAAHCVVDYTTTVPEHLVVAAGAINLKENVTGHHISRALVHPEYDSFALTNDLALVELKDPLEYTDNIKNIEIGSVKSGDNCTISGWGRIDDYVYPDDLYYLDTVAVSSDMCDDVIKICTLTKEGEGNCFGDSGSPLTSNGKLVGVVSSGVPCAMGVADAYTRVAYYSEWIGSTTGLNITV